MRRKSESLRLPSPLPPATNDATTARPTSADCPRPFSSDRVVRWAFEVLRPAHQHVVVAVRLDARVHLRRRSDVAAAGAGRQPPGRSRGRRHNHRGRHHCGHRRHVHRRRRIVQRLGRRSGVHCGQYPRHHRTHGHRRQRSAAG